MKKGIIFIVILALISVGAAVYYSQTQQNIEQSEAYTPWWFWSLAPKTRLMARTISAEARGESLVGQVAVGAVILNRVRDPKFPNTASGVIYQPWAFTAVARGYIWSHSPSERTIRATLAALRGWDPTYGCIYYYNPAKVTSRWIYSRQVVRRIGKHVFAR
ncbi:cell wall hydrolase [Halanaerobaculum tunisiense]